MVAEKKVRKIWDEGPVSGFRNNHIGAVRLCVRVCFCCVYVSCVWATFVDVCLLGWLTLGFFLDHLTVRIDSGSHP